MIFRLKLNIHVPTMSVNREHPLHIDYNKKMSLPNMIITIYILYMIYVVSDLTFSAF